MAQIPSTRPARDDPTGEPDYYRDFLFDCFEAIRSTSEEEQKELLRMIRSHIPLEEIRIYLNKILPDAQKNEGPSKNKKIKYDIKIEHDAPKFRPRSMDIRYLCGSAPYKVPARPWTNVTHDDDLVSHLVSLYMTWDYPFFAFFDRDTFLDHMAKGKLNSDFCSPFLVNALLANACDYSQYSEAYTVPGDVKTKGAAFLAEAEKYMSSHSFERGSDIRLATLQAILLLYERYSVLGHDNFGYTMLHRAIEMAEELKIVNNNKLSLNSSQMSEEMLVSVKRTAWGLFQIDTIVHTNFLKPSRVHEVCVDRIKRGERSTGEAWTPYPIPSYTRPSHMALYFDEACNLSYIARDISKSVAIAEKDGVDLNKVKQDMYDRLCQWEADLPDTFKLTERPAPHVLLLGMRYHALVINLCCDNFGYYSSFSMFDKRSPMNLSAESGHTAIEAAILSAREISAITQSLRTEYGIHYMHQFAMYAINVALYTLLEQPSVDILDPDFLCLASAFSVIANRSPVGRNLYHFFKLSIRSRSQGKKLQNSDEIPPEIKGIFRQDLISQSRDKEHHEVTSSAEDTRYMEKIEDTSQATPAPGLKEMIGEYEKLSMGKEERVLGHLKGDDF
ncbi:pathway-specific regulatory protein [Penicillium paradoxum]|uniref:pathway-specific regulatory protein n=1 Tax=Penicillium paradoxum TaxID=176176 RepID=UPI0025493287|nr:pathway-specific regulatory protein [Penicillium paradoxum]KAJ5788218.1 pathway-specific regulatory protein [Penicillium paradoxum]